MSNPRSSDSTALARVDVGSLTAEQIRTAEAMGALWKAEWTTLDKLQPKDLTTVGRIIVAAFPDFGPLEMLRYFTMLGGKIYETAEFWLHQAAQHPEFAGAEEFVELEPGTDDWNTYMGRKQEPGAIAAAVLFGAHRNGPGGHRTEREAGYTTYADPILSDVEWLRTVRTARNRTQAEELAKVEAGEGATVDVFFKRGKNGAPDEWVGKVSKLKPDAIALANKKARTTASRRVLRRLFSLSEARITTVLAHAQRVVESRTLTDREQAEAHDIGGGIMIRGAGAPVPDLKNAQDEYGARQTPRQEAKEQGYEAFAPPHVADGSGNEHYTPEARAAREHAEGHVSTPQPLKATSTHDPAADRAGQLVAEVDRKKLYADLDRRDITGLVSDEDPHEALHVLIRRLKKLPPNAPASTKDLTYPEWEQLRHAIEALPPLGDAAEPRDLTQDLKRSIDPQGGPA